MSCNSSKGIFLIAFLLTGVILLGGGVGPAWGQNGSQGILTVTVLDQSGGVVRGANLALQDVATNDVRNGVSQTQGTYSFVAVTNGTYTLTVSKDGFETQIYPTVTVAAARVTDLTVKLKVGSITSKVEVNENASPLVETSSNAIGTTIDMKQIEDLPIGGRDISSLATLVPGFNNANGIATWNGMPGGALGSNIDGVIAQTSRNRDASGGAAFPGLQARLEDIQEMTIQTDQLDLNQGFGQADMQINFVTRRGSNSYHGRIYDDFQNDGLNANNWSADAVGFPKQKFILDDFGASVGGPILKDKLFFFGSYAEQKQPGTNVPSNNVLTPAAQSGIFTYADTNGITQTVNLFQIAQNAGLPSADYTVNSVIAAEQAKINGVLSDGLLTATGFDPNLNMLQWKESNPITGYFPAIRVDYNVSQTFRVNFAWNETKFNLPTANTPVFPGAAFAYQNGNVINNINTSGIGFDWTIRPTLVNQFRGGFLYYFQGNNANAGNIYQTHNLVFWGVPTNTQWGAFMSGEFFYTAQTNYYPLFNLSDTMTWQHGAHTMSYGASGYREQDHYWNPPLGYLNIGFGLAGGDPAANIFTNGPTGTLANAPSGALGEAQQLYADLIGDINGAGGAHPLDPKTSQFVPFGGYNLDELQHAWGLFFQDSYRLKANLTLNYGLRWDFTGDDYDLKAAYHGITSVADVYGPSGLNNEFNPGSLLGNPDPLVVARGHQYNPWDVSPQPSVGFAWNPQYTEGFLGKLTGGGGTTIRAGYAIRRYLPSYQTFWSFASDYGSYFYQGFNVFPSTTPQPGSYTPGSFRLGDPLPTPVLSPPTYTNSVPESAETFVGPGLTGIDPQIHQPYIQSWNLGIQRKLGKDNAIEIRYVGNKGTHEWLALNTNEVNIFQKGFFNQPGFLDQFVQAQTNLKLNNALPSSNPYFGTFAYDPAVAGEAALPIFDAAFAGEPTTGPGGPLVDYANNNAFIVPLQTGQAGLVASTLSGLGGGNAPFFCNLVGSNNFNPCVANQGIVTGNGGGYPINYFQANPLQAGNSVGLLTSGGYSNYNSLQVEFRQNNWHGMQFNVNYTWSHALGLAPPFTGDNTLPGFYTLRDLRLNYQPSAADIRQVTHANGTYDLPFGSGKRFLNHKGLLDRAIGGWTVGTIFLFQTGTPFKLGGGYLTYNSTADGGVNLNGMTRSQLQNDVGVFPITPTAGAPVPFLDTFNPSLLNSVDGGIKSGTLTPNIIPGTINAPIWLYGPHFLNVDMAITKRIPIRENVRFTFQAEFLNAFNHPNFGNPDAGVQDFGFGTGYPSNGPRAIELRGNIEF